MTSPSIAEITFDVEGLPPGKNEAKSLLATTHAHAPRVRVLLVAARAAVGSQFVPWVERLGLDVTVYGEADGDATNYLGGIGDVLQQARRNLPSDAGAFLQRRRCDLAMSSSGFGMWTSGANVVSLSSVLPGATTTGPLSSCVTARPIMLPSSP